MFNSRYNLSKIFSITLISVVYIVLIVLLFLNFVLGPNPYEITNKTLILIGIMIAYTMITIIESIYLLNKEKSTK